VLLILNEGSIIMKKGTFITIFILAHVGFASLQIHKQNIFTKLSYEAQKKEKTKLEFHEKKKQLTQQRHIFANHAVIKDFAQKKLGMESVSIAQIKKM
jgi:hypothetical protein